MSDMKKYINLIESSIKNGSEQDLQEGIKDKLKSITNKLKNKLNDREVKTVSDIQPMGKVHKALSKYVEEGENYEYVYTMNGENIREFGNYLKKVGFTEIKSTEGDKYVFVVNVYGTRIGTSYSARTADNEEVKYDIQTIIIVVEAQNEGSIFALSATKPRPYSDELAEELQNKIKNDAK